MPLVIGMIAGLPAVSYWENKVVGADNPHNLNLSLQIIKDLPANLCVELDKLIH
jgi:hypothetical protein